MIIGRYETVGTEYCEDELGPTLGYDNIETGFFLAKNEDVLADWWADGLYRKLDIICEIETLGK